MKLKKTAAKATLVGSMGAAALGLGAGLAQADPMYPSPPPPWMPAEQGSAPGVSVNGPSLNAPGISVQGPSAGVTPPVWAPPAPPSPPWAPTLPVQWDAGAQAWGVYTNAGFQPVQ
jgi:hypothetical protein